MSSQERGSFINRVINALRRTEQQSSPSNFLERISDMSELEAKILDQYRERDEYSEIDLAVHVRLLQEDIHSSFASLEKRKLLKNNGIIPGDIPDIFWKATEDTYKWHQYQDLLQKKS